MSTIKSSAENLTLNADGANNDVLIQSNGSTKITVDGGTGGVGIGTTVANKIFNISDPAQGGEALKLHFEASASSDKFGIYTYDRTNSHYADLSLGQSSIYIHGSTNTVTMPNQPAFSVLPASNNATNTDIEVGGSATKVAFGTEIFDVGTNYGNDTFTAPVTGKYVFSANIRFNNMDSAAAYYAVMIQTSNRIYYNLIDPDFGQDTPQWNANMSVLADMDANDTAFVNVYQHTGTEQTDVEHTMSIFTGYLAC